MPNVPFAPGVPTLSNYAQGAVALLTRDAIGLLAGNLSPQWGLYLNGVSAITAENVVTFDYKKSYTVANYPIEQGAFESYDKVEDPFVAQIRFSSGGGRSARQALIASAEAVADTTELYDVVTPEKVYRSVNVTHVDYRRSAASGLGLVVIDLWVQQIRVTATATFTNTKTPSGAGQSNSGTVQSIPATSAQQSLASGLQ